MVTGLQDDEGGEKEVENKQNEGDEMNDGDDDQPMAIGLRDDEGGEKQLENKQNEGDGMDDAAPSINEDQPMDFQESPARPSRPSRNKGRTTSFSGSVTTTSLPKKLKKRAESVLPRQVVEVEGKWFEAVDLTTNQVQFHAL